MMISCIMPTADRRRFIVDSIRRFFNQDYRNKELIIVDDGSEPIEDLVPRDSRVRYIRQEQRMVLGAKRNFCCSLARGEIIAHWDDDDYYAPWRLTRQMEKLGDGFDICGLAQTLIYDQRENKAYQHTVKIHEFMTVPWLYGATFCYRKSMWEKNQFSTTRHRGEDDNFVGALKWHQVGVMEDLEMFVARKHSTNTGFGFEIAEASSCLTSFPLDRVIEIMGEDFSPHDPEARIKWMPAFNE